jgi:hypothetical protein
LPRGYDVLLHPALEVNRGEDNYRLLRRMYGTNTEALEDCTYMGWLERKVFQLDVRTNCDKFKDFFERFSTEEEGRVITCDDKCMWRILKMQEFSLNFFITVKFSL